MAVSPIVLSALIFVGVCWFIGARSRLLRLRDGVRSAGQVLSISLQQQANWVLAQTAHQPRQAHGTAWPQAQAAAAQVLTALLSMDRKGRGPRWPVVCDAKGAQLAALQKVYFEENGVSIQNKENLGGNDVIPHENFDFQMHLNRVQSAEQAYNEAACRYNLAIAMFPASALACLLRLSAAEIFTESTSKP